jgi:NAD(P) transhydrogenase
MHLAGFRQRGIQGVNVSLQDQAGTQDLLYRERLVRQLEQTRIRTVFDQARITLFHGHASFAGPSQLKVEMAGGLGGEELLSAEAILIATGSSPWRSELFATDDPAVFDSETILQLSRIPKRLAIVGGGVIGSEYACIFAAFGVQVTLIEEGERLLTFLDRDLSAALLASMRAQGIDVRLQDSVLDIRRGTPTGLMLASGASMEVDAVFACNGRKGNTVRLNLPAVGLLADERGFLAVDENGRTTQPGVYAAGDVVGFPALATSAREQAERAVRHAFSLPVGTGGVAPALYGIYTIPECSMVGETEASLVERHENYVAGIAHFAANIKGQIIGAKAGFLKLLFHRETKKLLGVHLFGESASELVHIGVIALQAGATTQLFLDTHFNYPTLGELYKMATLDALEKCKPAKPVGSLLRPRG